MEEKCAEERWALVNSTENSEGGGDENDEEEALSLCDLPLIHQSSKENEEEEGSPLRPNIETQEDFDFCSLSKESEMCAADEVFYRGQILPLLQSQKGFSQISDDDRNFSRSESMDDYSSSGLISSRSSSISSHQSSSSGSSSGCAATADPKCRPKLPPRNQFNYSHPSPSPRIRFPSNRPRNRVSGSSAWNIFRLGLVTTPPEIAFQDLKTRSPSNTNSKKFGGRNSTNDKKKIKPRALLGGCNCSVDAVDTIPSKVVIIKRSASDGESEVRALRGEEENLVAMKSPKKRLSHHRTFEWLRQLSLEGGGG